MLDVMHFAEIILSINLKRNPLVPLQGTDPYLLIDPYFYMAAFFIQTHRICQQVCIHMAYYKLQQKWVSQGMICADQVLRKRDNYKVRMF
jgi:hypothetical protein